MIKKLILWCTIIFVLALGVSAALTVTGSNSITVSNLSNSESIVLTLSNTGSSPIQVTGFNIIDFNVTQYTIPSSKFTFNRTPSFTIAAGASDPVNVTVDLSGTNAYNTTYNGKINMTTNETGTFNEYALGVTVSGNSNLSANNIDVDIAQGQTGTATLTLTNDGNTDVTGATLPSTVTLTSTTNSSNILTATIAATSLDVDYQSTNTTTITVPVLATAAKERYENNVTVSYDSKSVNFTISVDVVAPSYSINVVGTNFGEADQNSTVSTTATITNNGNAALTNVNLSSNIEAKYNATFNQTTPFSLGINGTRDIIVTAFIPEDESTSNHSIGSVDVLSDQNNFTSAFSLFADVQGKLMIDDLDVIVDKDIGGNRVSSTNLDDGEKIDEEARPGSKIELDFKIRNQFSDESEIDINNVVITITVKDMDQGDDIEEESDEFDLDADTTERQTVEFEVPLIVDKDTYEIEIHVEGEDDNGADHEVDWIIRLEVDKKGHDVMILDADVQPSLVRCSRRTTLDVELLNTGKREEDEVKLEAKNSALGLNFEERRIELEKGVEDDNIHQQEIPIQVDEDVEAGTYPITVNAYYDTTILDDSKTVDLVVEDCKIAKKEEKEEEEVVVVENEKNEDDDTTGPEIIIGDIPTDTEVDVSVEKSFTQSPTYVILLVLVNIVVVAGLLGLAAKFLLFAKPPMM